MENKEIKRITRLESHDCNECEECQRDIRFGLNHCNFSSSNKEVDEIIKNPIYLPPKSKYQRGRALKYEWIPWERLSNVNEIARGGFGKIYKATWIDGPIHLMSIKHHREIKYKREGTAEVAIKIIKTNSEEVFKEGMNYISSMYGITQNAETLEYGIVMPFAKFGDMRKYLSTNFHSTSWSNKLIIAHLIAEGLEQIHSFGMVHCDLHSGNILQFNEDEVNIGDLGLCQPVNHEGTTTTDPTTGKDMKEKKIYGVIPYIPPEVLRGEKFTLAGDIYSYGMLLWELSTGKPPFYDCKHDHILIMAILDGARPKITSPLIPPCIAQIILKCWDDNPENRPTAEEVYEMLEKLWNMYRYFSIKRSPYKEWFPDEEFSSEESTTVSLQFLESDKYVKEMAESDDSTTTTRIHPGAVYTSRVLTLQMIQETKG
ncbi:hypothetical protein G9A89_004419 [Geosiphon pyriformis]|nr:hypothetical protein G9A89_004419 [Geosiphon pyriformis]